MSSCFIQNHLPQISTGHLYSITFPTVSWIKDTQESSGKISLVTRETNHRSHSNVGHTRWPSGMSCVHPTWSQPSTDNGSQSAEGMDRKRFHGMGTSLATVPHMKGESPHPCFHLPTVTAVSLTSTCSQWHLMFDWSVELKHAVLRKSLLHIIPFLSSSGWCLKFKCVAATPFYRSGVRNPPCPQTIYPYTHLLGCFLSIFSLALGPLS